MSRQPAAIKFCGITRVEDAVVANQLAVDAIGLVFWSKSKRSLNSLQQATEIAAVCSPFVSVTGLFVDPDVEWVERVLAAVPLNLIQFHGSETDAFCRQFQRPFIKALRMKEDIDLKQAAQSFASARGVLLDTYCKGSPGGTGVAFDWKRFPEDAERKFVLAGGLKPENVAQAIQISGANAVDVSGGIESSPGVKDPVLMKSFVDAVRSP